ncbi:MAG: hypothetical protein IT167_31020 [Bryobacterales bacterium]|nr:hypothetical protein [Bryobacterales bacterium]
MFPRLVVLSFLSAICAWAQPKAGVRILLGVTDQATTKWDGSVQARGARITSIEPWRFDGQDAMLGGNSWKCETHPPRLFGAQSAANSTVRVANGVMVWLDGDGANVELAVETAQGNFTVRLSDVPYGSAAQPLNGRAMVDRIPPVERMTNDPREQDYPSAAAARDGSVWVAYVEFKHHPDHDRLRTNFTTAPASFDEWKAPPGGDRVLVRRYAAGKWDAPIALTAGQSDIYRPAVAIDGGGRVWVFWSANENGNFDLYARAVGNGSPGRTVRVTNAPGSDVDAVAAVDSKGQVWVAWQAWRNGKAEILAASQKGDGFSSPSVVSSSSGNEWNPAVAADSAGRVTVAYDSYRNGNYDVYARTASNGAWRKEFLVAGSAAYEAYPTLAYDPRGRLWVAYEEGAERWGKDFGAYSTSGVAVYQGREARLAGFEKDGRAVAPVQPPDSVLPGTPTLHVESAPHQPDESWLKPDTTRATNREANRAAQNFAAPRNSMPRLAVDASGRLWLAVRSAHPVWWNPLGTVWSEYVISFDGSKWTGPVFLAHSNNILDNRPALVSRKGGELLVVGSSDSRRRLDLNPERERPRVLGSPDPYNNDLFLNTVVLAPAGGTFAVKEAAAPTPAPADPRDKAEQAMVAVMRAARFATRYGELRILRGEFHRHSEISMDGGNDGTLVDQYRYMIDSARMDWVGCCDHDNGGGREYSWWIQQKLTDLFYTPGRFVPMFSYERSVPYPEGHRNVIFAERGIRTLPRLPITKADVETRAPDTQMLYRYLKQFHGVVGSHTSGTNMGTDWRDNDPVSEPVVEIYQGDRQNYEIPGGPRSNSAQDSIGGWRPKGFVSLALERGYKLSFEASSDHISTHLSYCNILARDSTRQSVLDAVRQRHVYGATDDILAEFRCGDNIMGDSFRLDKAPEFLVKLQGTSPFSKVVIVKDGKYVYSSEPETANVQFTWRDNQSQTGKTSYYYVRGLQENAEVVWVSPMWVTR